MKKNVILSFDYEIFFGPDCGVVEDCLIRPTERILDELKRVNGRAVFFVDYLMLKRMREECDETRKTALAVEEQLCEILRGGSRIELHLHPHWIDAKYRGGGKWDFSDNRHYCLQSLPEKTVTNLFVEGTDYLNRLARQVIPDYKVKVFRAGGWAVLPFAHLANGFRNAGIRIDSSVSSGIVLGNGDERRDFSKAPKASAYSFSNNVTCADPEGEFVEIQITSFRLNLLTYVLNALHRRLNRRKYCHHAKGSYMGAGGHGSVSAPKRIPLLKRPLIPFMFTLGGVSKIAYIFHLLFSRRRTAVFIDHPKDFNDIMIENLAFLARFVEFVAYEDLLLQKPMRIG